MTRTSAPTTRNKRGASTTTTPETSGFSLLEILVVVAIIGIFSMFALPSISSYFQVSLASASRELAMTIKETYNGAVVSGHVYRMVYDLKERQFWSESGPTTLVLDTKESKEREERRKKFARGAGDDKPAPSGFSMDKSVTRKKVTLPTGVEFEDLVTQQSSEPITEGSAYTHFFPHGLTEQTIIHLQDSSKHHFTLVISPIAGQVDLYERYVPKSELEGAH